jgi:NAD(P) transhydrogenase subunit beta
VSILINAAYLASIALFILGLKLLSSPRTARRGNALSALGMLVAVAVTLLDRQIIDYTWIVAGIVVGGTLGVVLARTIRMTAMPQMVALLNGLGGIASVLVVLAEFLRLASRMEPTPAITTAATLLVGMVTFTGSLVAFGKLQGVLAGAPVVFPGQQFLNLALLLSAVALGVLFSADPVRGNFAYLLGIAAAAGVLGVTLVLPIGGADMPVVISLLNSYSGIAAAASGFVIGNNVLIVSGALVGASGIILSNLMCKAMNRSLTNVLFGAVGAPAEASGAGQGRVVTRYTTIDASAMLENARSVVVVPGYGLAVSQAQFALQEVVELLQQREISVLYAIHPVAGRMPGHMNVLLAEAHAPYEILKDLEEINSEFQNTDVVLVAGANDVINPAARRKGSPLSGMPILNVDQARTIIIIKRSLAPGFAGVDNELFYDPKTLMVFGDAKDILVKLVGALKTEAA